MAARGAGARPAPIDRRILERRDHLRGRGNARDRRGREDLPDGQVPAPRRGRARSPRSAASRSTSPPRRRRCGCATSWQPPSSRRSTSCGSRARRRSSGWPRRSSCTTPRPASTSTGWPRSPPSWERSSASTPERVELLRVAAPMHDVGKIAIPDEILRKPGPLTPEERAEMQRHTVVGHEILADSESELLPHRGDDRADPSRALRRQRLPAGPGRRGDPARGADHRGRRRLRRPAQRPLLPAGDQRRRGGRDHRRGPRDPFRSGDSRRFDRQSRGGAATARLSAACDGRSLCKPRLSQVWRSSGFPTRRWRGSP